MNLDRAEEILRAGVVPGHRASDIQAACSAVLAELDRLRGASPTIACQCGRKIHIPALELVPPVVAAWRAPNTAEHGAALHDALEALDEVWPS